MKMTYDEARQYIKEASKAGIRPGLSCMRELCRRLGNPQDDLKIIHIAGTNGKGSTAAYLSSIFGVNGYLTFLLVNSTVCHRIINTFFTGCFSCHAALAEITVFATSDWHTTG